MGSLVELPDELEEFIQRPDFKLVTLLRRSDFQDLVMLPHPRLAALLAGRAGEFVYDFCFPPKSASSSFRSFMVKIIKANPPILDALLDGNDLYNIAQSVFANGDTDAVRALTDICGKVLWRDRQRFCKCCGFLFQFLRFVHLPWVTSLFIALVAKREDNEIVQQWLIDNCFIALLAKQIVMQSDDDPPAKFENALSVISEAMATDKLLDVFKTKDVVDGLKWKIGAYPKHVEAERWVALAKVYCEELADNYHDLADAISHIIIDIDDAVYIHHVAAIDLLTLMLERDEVVRMRLMTTSLHVTMIGFLTKFPEHSNYHATFVRFAVSVLKSPIISELWGAFMLSRFSDWLSGQEHTLLVETCLAVFEFADDLGDEDERFQKLLEKIPSVAACICEKVRPRVQTIKDGYGGSVPKDSERERAKLRSKKKTLNAFLKRMSGEAGEVDPDDND